jgi:hypothetical protein
MAGKTRGDRRVDAREADCRLCGREGQAASDAGEVRPRLVQPRESFAVPAHDRSWRALAFPALQPLRQLPGHFYRVTELTPTGQC